MLQRDSHFKKKPMGHQVTNEIAVIPRWPRERKDWCSRHALLEFILRVGRGGGVYWLHTEERVSGSPTLQGTPLFLSSYVAVSFLGGKQL